MRNFLSSFIILCLLIVPKFYSQGEGALPFTTLQQSPLLFGAGQIGVSIPNDDVLGFYLNPAILGYSARENHASISFMPNKTEWFSWGWNDNEPTFNNFGFNVGYNLKSSQLNLPISIGFGYIHNKFIYGKHFYTSDYSPEIIDEMEDYDLFNSFSLGIGFDYFVRINLGVSLKSFDSQLGGAITNDQPIKYSVDGTMFDYGALLTIPVSDLLIKDKNYQLDNSLEIKPTANFSIGYSLSNVGDKIFYVDESQKDPLSRTARLGYTIDLGLDLKVVEKTINLVNYSFTAEAQDIMVKSDSLGMSYQSGFGDISISDNIIKLKSDENVIVHKGHIIKFFDTVIFTSGRFFGHGYSTVRKTSGIGFTSTGIFNLLNNYTDNNVLNYITKHFVIDYFNADVEFFESVDTNFETISIYYRGFEF